jgi:hypothetical protein
MDATNILNRFMRFPYNFSMFNEKNDPMNQAGIAFSLEQMIPNQSKLNAKKSYINSLLKLKNQKVNGQKTN